MYFSHANLGPWPKCRRLRERNGELYEHYVQ